MGLAAVPGAAGPAALAVTRLTVTDFRCYATARMELDARPVLLTGPNGAGKTNLLEAVSLLAPGKGLRGAALEAIDRRDGPGGWAVAGEIAGTQGPVRLGTGRRVEATRRDVRVDGAPAPGQAALARHFAAVWLTPQMDRLFLDGAVARRRFLDRLIYAMDAGHAGRVSAYDKALRDRARLLKEGRADPAWLGALERQIAERGVAIAAARRAAMGDLDAATRAPIGPFPGARLGLRGAVEEWLDGAPALAVEDRLAQALAASRREDAHTGGAAVGPHRTDFAVARADTGVAAGDCSTGEQKALLIAITLAHARLLADRAGAAPVLLLDEVAAHLDAERRAALFDTLRALGVQAWLTGTDAALFAGLSGACQHFHVAAARLRPA